MALDVSLAEKSPAQLGVVVAAVAVVYFAAYQLLLKPLYNLFFHPLRHYPGPKLWAAYRIPYARSAVSGKHHQNIHELHLRYGDIVRVSPTELSYTRADAWKEIMGHRKKGQSENGKDPKFFRMGQVGIFPSDRERHSLHRRILGPGFSTKSMAAQQPLIQHYIDLLFRKIRESAAHSSIDIMSWYNYTTFDIIGDLAFGEPFGCLENSALNSWVSIIFESMRELNLIIALRPFFPNIDAFIMKLFPSAVVKDQERRDLGNAKIDKRMSLTTQRHDFMDSMTNKDAKGSLSKEEIYENSQGLIAAGSETTATALTFVTYFLCKHPHVLAKLRAEVDAHFTDESEIDMTRVQSLTYMLAVIDETMRLYPVVPTTPPRLSPPEGQEICGRFVPGNVSTTGFLSRHPPLGMNILTKLPTRTDHAHH